MAAVGFHARYLSGSLQYVRRHITVNKLCCVRRCSGTRTVLVVVVVVVVVELLVVDL